jgi:polyisoprenoid-binding protein YceI
LSVIVAAQVAFAAWAEEPAVKPGDYQAKVEIAFDGTSSVRNFTCKAQNVKATLDAVSAPGPLSLDVRGIDVEVPVAQLECGDGTMNAHLRDAMLAQKHPTIVFKLVGDEAVTQEADALKLRLGGELTMAGQGKPISLEANIDKLAEGALKARGSHTIRMTDRGVKPPSLFFGVMNVGETVVVRYTVEVTRAPAPPRTN